MHSFLGEIHLRVYILVSLEPMKYLKPLLPKETLLDTTILLISIFFIKTGL